VSKQCTLVAQKTSNILGSVRKSTVNRSKEVMFPLLLGTGGVLEYSRWRTYGVLSPVLGSPVQERDIDLLGERSAQGHKDDQGTGASSI